MSLRIAYVVKRYPRYSETFIVNEILAHEAAGVDVEIFSLYPTGDTHFQNSISAVKAPVHYIPSKGIDAADFWNAMQTAIDVLPDIGNKIRYVRHSDARYVYQAMLLAQGVCRKELDHIHSHFATSSTTVARLASYFSDVPYSFTAHAKDIFHRDSQNEHLELKVRDASAVVTVSDFNVRYLTETIPEAVKKVLRIYNGIDLSALNYSVPDNRPPEIVAVGRFVEKKGFQYLIKACRLLIDRGLTFHCSIIGFGELESQLRAQINALGLHDFVELTGPLPQGEVIRRIQRSAVLVAPCIIGEDGNRDGLPTVLLESMALGTPCISTDVTGIPEVIQDGVSGLLAPQKDEIALSDHIETLLTNPFLRIGLSQNARKLIEEQFDIHRNTALLRSIFTSSKCYSQAQAVSG